MTINGRCTERISPDMFHEKLAQKYTSARHLRNLSNISPLNNCDSVIGYPKH